MRCPQCGYISFDDRESCLKCASDLLALAGSLNGTAFAFPAPAFLAVALAARDESSEEAEIVEEEKPDDDWTGPEEPEKLGEPGEDDEEPGSWEDNPDLLELETFSRPGEESAGPDHLDLLDLDDPSRREPAGMAMDLFDVTLAKAADYPADQAPDHAAAKVSWPEDQELEDISDLLGETAPGESLPGGPVPGPPVSPSPPSPSAPSEATARSSAEPILSLDEEAPLGAAAPSQAPPEIPDLGLSLEISDESEISDDDDSDK